MGKIELASRIHHEQLQASINANNGKCVGMLWVVFIANIWNRVFWNGDTIILLHGELVKSNFDGFKSPKLGFSYLLRLLEMSPTSILDLVPFFFAEVL